MELSYFLAQLFGLTMMVFGVLMWIKPRLVDGMVGDLQQHVFSRVMAGFIGVVAGLAIILSHNIWEFGWVGLVTLFGWSAFLKGISYVAFPKMIFSTAGSILKSGKRQLFVSMVVFLIGAYLTYNGFGLGM
jgi:hypothetical protein